MTPKSVAAAPKGKSTGRNPQAESRPFLCSAFSTGKLGAGNVWWLLDHKWEVGEVR